MYSKFLVKAKSEKDNNTSEMVIASTFLEVESKYLENHPNHCIIAIERIGIIISGHTFDIKF